MATTATHRAGQYSTFPQERSRTEGEQRPASSACLHASAGLSTSQRWGAAGVGVHPLRRGRSVAPIPEIRPCFEARAALFPAAARPKPPRGRAGQGSHVRGAIAGVQHEPGHFGAFVQPGDAASYDSRRPFMSVGRGGGASSWRTGVGRVSRLHPRLTNAGAPDGAFGSVSQLDPVRWERRGIQLRGRVDVLPKAPPGAPAFVSLGCRRGTRPTPVRQPLAPPGRPTSAICGCRTKR